MKFGKTSYIFDKPTIYNLHIVQYPMQIPMVNINFHLLTELLMRISIKYQQPYNTDLRSWVSLEG